MLKVVSSLVVLVFLLSCNPTELKTPEISENLNDGPEIQNTRCQTSLQKRYKSKSIEDAIFAEGTLNEIVYDGDFSLENPPSKSAYHFTTSEGVNVVIDENFPSIKTQPLNTPIVMALSQNHDGSYSPYVADDNLEYAAPIDSSSTGCDQAQSRRLESQAISRRDITVALFLRSKDGRYDQAKVDYLAKILKDYWYKVSKGSYVLEVFPFLVNITGDEDFETKANQMYADFRAETGKSASYKHYLYWQGATYSAYFQGQVCGIGGGSTARTYCLSERTMLHEQGHCFGYGHASSESAEYGDSTSIMGNNGTKPLHLHAQQTQFKNFQADGAYRELAKTEKVFLAPIAADNRKIYAGIDQIINVKNKYIGFRGGNTEEFEISSQVVQIHTRGSRSGSSSGSTLHANIRAGSSTSYEGIRVDFIRMIDGYAEVDVYYNSGDAAPSARELPSNGPQCIGSTPKYATLCSGDAEGLVSDLNISLVDTCSSQIKCEYSCNSGYKLNLAGDACIVDENVCEGAVPANAVLCADDDKLLQSNVLRSLVDSCSEANKCEYTCKSGYIFTDGVCKQVLPVQIYASTSNPPSAANAKTVFKLGVDTIHWRVKNASYDAFGCIAYEAADGSRGNKNAGHCNSLSDFTEMKNQTPKDWFWSDQYQVWALANDLTGPTYFIPGKYWMYWYNPITKQKDEYIFEVVE